MAKVNSKDAAQKVVDRIIGLIEQGKPLPWVKPWGRKPATVTVIDGWKTITMESAAWSRDGKEYRGTNTYLPRGEYIGFGTALKEHAAPNKGSKSYPVVYWNYIKKTKHNEETGEDEEVIIPVLKYWNVFNVNDCHKTYTAGYDKDGKPIEKPLLDENGKQVPLTAKHDLPPHVWSFPITHEEEVEDADTSGLNDTAEAVIADYISRAGNGFRVVRDKVSDEAFYSPALDYVNVPCREQFIEMTEFYSTMFHELGHSTGHSTRLNRFTGKAGSAAFGSETYSREELVAESTAATILNAIGLEEANTFRNSAAYIKDWASHIKEDPMMYVTAMNRAQAAVDLILGVENTDEADVDVDDEAAE